jgi:hypothetical protein
MNPEFADLFSKHYSGDYTFIGENNDILQKSIWDTIASKKSQATKMAEDYNDYIEGIG